MSIHLAIRAVFDDAANRSVRFLRRFSVAYSADVWWSMAYCLFGEAL